MGERGREKARRRRLRWGPQKGEREREGGGAFCPGFRPQRPIFFLVHALEREAGGKGKKERDKCKGRESGWLEERGRERELLLMFLMLMLGHVGGAEMAKNTWGDCCYSGEQDVDVGRR